MSMLVLTPGGRERTEEEYAALLSGPACVWTVTFRPGPILPCWRRRPSDGAARGSQAQTRPVPEVQRPHGTRQMIGYDRISTGRQGCAAGGSRMVNTNAVFVCSILVTSSAFAQPTEQTVAIGPWEIATTYKAGKFDSCSMSRTAGDLAVSFVRAESGLLLLLDSSKWKLERAVPIRFAWRRPVNPWKSKRWRKRRASRSPSRRVRLMPSSEQPMPWRCRQRARHFACRWTRAR